MQITKRAVAAFKALGVVSTVMIVASGVTFAALQSQNVVLQGNRLTSATAGLLLGTGDGQFLSAAPGFSFDNVEPGGAALPQAGHRMYFRNTGTSDLHARVTLNPNMIRNLNSIPLSKVFLVVGPASGSETQQISFSALASAYTSNTSVPLNFVIPAGQEVPYLLRMQMSADAVSSASTAATIENIDLIFSGVTQGN